MPWNIFLAFISVFFGLFMFRASSLKLKVLFGFIWLLFVPNSIYILTDLIHFPSELARTDSLLVIPLFLEYLILEICGIFAFVLSVYFFEVTLKNKTFKLKSSMITLLIILANFLIGFGIVVGRVQRTNSWEVITNPGRVLRDAYNIVVNPNLFVFTITMGVLGNLVYFFLKDPIVHRVKPRFFRKKKK